jgi:hypothetical protein
MTENFSDDGPAGDTASSPSDAEVQNISGIQGLKDGSWTAGDGTTIHGGYEGAAEAHLTRLDHVDYVESEYPVRVANEDGSLRNGKIDTYVEHGNHTTLIDYKSHDMANWTPAKAKASGQEHGQQMWEYLQSEDTPANAQGFILQVGRPSNDPEVMQAYRKHAEAFPGVRVISSPGGDLQSVARSTEDAVSQTKNT